MVSLTLHRTLVEDLSFVRKLPVIQRLHIGETLITDLTPLKGVNLTRLVFSPERIKRGLDVVKRLSNLREIGTKFDDTGRDLTSPKKICFKILSNYKPKSFINFETNFLCPTVWQFFSQDLNKHEDNFSFDLEVFK